MFTPKVCFVKSNLPLGDFIDACIFTLHSDNFTEQVPIGFNGRLNCQSFSNVQRLHDTAGSAWQTHGA